MNPTASSQFDAMAARLGIREFTSLQKQAIERLVATSVPGTEECPCHLVHLPTGAGKTLIFMAAGAICREWSLVVYPLIALLDDQKRRFDEAGLVSYLLRGGMGAEGKAALFHEIMRKPWGFILCTPEILADPGVQAFLSFLGPRHAIIDEAHVIAQWGMQFRPAYQRLGLVLAALGMERISAFSATAGPQIRDILRTHLFLGNDFQLLEGCLDRPNIMYHRWTAPHPLRSIADTAGTVALPLPALVFCGTRKGTEIAAEKLSRWRRDIPVRFFHAGLERHEKEMLCEWFFRAERAILCATSAYGMGVDKKGIRSVVHICLPGSVEEFLQESGRAGRDGKPAWSITLSGTHDRGKGIMTSWPGLATCRRAFLLQGLLGHGPDMGDEARGPGGQPPGQPSCCDNCRDASRPGYPHLHPPARATMRLLQKQAWTWKVPEVLEHLARDPDFASWHPGDRSDWLKEAIILGLLRVGKLPPVMGTLALSRDLLDNPHW